MIMENHAGTHLFNDGWSFAKFPLDITREMVRNRLEDFCPVGLPHDWLIYQGTNLYENSSGWYRRELFLPLDAQKEEKRYVLRFEGIYMDSTIYINNKEAAVWKYGYSTFEVTITPFLTEGINEILVRVNHQAPNSRWYSGAGIYRDVWLKVTPLSHLVSDGSYVTVKQKEETKWSLQVQTEVRLEDEKYYETSYSLRLLTGTAGRPQKAEPQTTVSGTGFIPEGRAAVGKERGFHKVSYEMDVNRPLIWDINHPHRYELTVCLLCDGEEQQRESYTIGFRRITFTPDQGFQLNGRKVKLNGVCEHHDLGCLGAAYNSGAMNRKLKILKKMGANALRLSHNMPAPDVMELADEWGFLVVSEAFDMWERSKTPYDYARFFPEWYEKDVAGWIRRDRNHPSLMMWSIGNEIYDTHVDERGQALTEKLKAAVREHDPLEHAPITIGSNYMPWEHAQKCADIVKLAGYNYSEAYYNLHHEAHPDWVIYGSETASTVQSRGIYHFPYHQPMLADEDEQCSALGNSTTSWGAKSSEACVIAERDHEFSCGQFLWTGFDYIGEPTPYHTRNSYFGQIDTAGFPKDSYYIYQAEWTDGNTAPMVHLFPYWDFNHGQLIDVRVCSNASRVELFLNGESLGAFDIDHRHGHQLAGHWQIPYQEGTLRACAYDVNGAVVAEESRSSFGEAAGLVLKADKDSQKGDGRDLVFVEITAEDEGGNPVENGTNRVYVSVTGAGRLAGLDNGDSTDEDEYKTDNRRLFSGKLLAVIAADTVPGEVTVKAWGKGLKEAELTIPVMACEPVKGVSRLAYGVKIQETEGAERISETPVRAIRLYSSEGTSLDAEHSKSKVTAVLCPPDADDRELVWRVVNDAGIESTVAKVEAQGDHGEITAQSDGTCKLRCMSRAGTGHIRIISELNFTVTGMGKAWLNPYTFISAGLYDISKGSVSNGNEHGVATARDGETWVGFSGIDFGPFGSDEIRLPVFALTDEACPIEIWEGLPDKEGSRLVADVVYQKPSIWNVYQEETYRLNRRIRGISSICFVLRQKIHLKGFQFIPLEKAYQKLLASECDQIYGDSFLYEGTSITQIGNNVTLRYLDMDFGSRGTSSVTICGHTPMENNTIQLRFLSEEGERVQMVEFRGGGEQEQTFVLTPAYGICEVGFVFLPGSRFDFHWFRFQE